MTKATIMNLQRTSTKTKLTRIQKYNAHEMALQLKRDFKFHLSEEIDLEPMTYIIETGNSEVVNRALAELTILYSDKIKQQSNAMHC